MPESVAKAKLAAIEVAAAFDAVAQSLEGHKNPHGTYLALVHAGATLIIFGEALKNLPIK